MQHLRKGKSLALKIYDTFDKSFVKNPGECLFSSGHVIVCNFFDFVYLFSIYLFIFFLKLSSKMLPLNGPRYYGDRWGKQPRVRAHESHPAVPLRWLARKIKYFSGQSEGENSNSSGTGSVRVTAQGLSRSCCKLSPMKIPTSRRPWTSEDAWQVDGTG